MFKNLTIRQLTYIVIGCLTVCYLIFITFYYYLSSYFPSAAAKVGFVVASLLINGYLVKLLIEQFIFRKIKVIYKIIRESKLTKKEKESVDIGAQKLENVAEDVETWAAETKSEIEALKSLEEYRKSYVGNISHELKTPIFSIQGYLQTLIEGGLHDPGINMNFLRKARDNAERLQYIIEDMETISRIESNEIVLEYNNFDIKALIQEIFDDLAVQARERNAKLTFKESAASNYIVKADKESIRQVLINLIVNAIKYGKDNGVVKVSLYDLETQILVEISDNGPGIEEVHLKHLFDRFYRVDKSRSRKIGGSGLGLSIVKHIIEAHNQTINVRSTINLGSTFGFTLDKGDRKGIF
jgi:two-component system, OmpR family, phosphate regulon sensor histidine kinase PhoR